MTAPTAGSFCHPENPGSTHWSGCECHEKAHAEEVRRLRAALEEIAGGVCRRNWYTAGRSLACRDIAAVKRHDWCPACIALAALAAAEKGGDRG